MICRIDSGSGKTLVYTSLALSSPPSTYTAPSTCMPVLAWQCKSAVNVIQETVPVCPDLHHASTCHNFKASCAMCDTQCSMEMVPTRGTLKRSAAQSALHGKRRTDSNSSATIESLIPCRSVTIDGPTTRYSFNRSCSALLQVQITLISAAPAVSPHPAARCQEKLLHPCSTHICRCAPQWWAGGSDSNCACTSVDTESYRCCGPMADVHVHAAVVVTGLAHA